jgi:hypothetical protein
MKPLQALLALFACAFLPLHAASLADLTYTTTGGKVTITDCDEAATGGLVIPATIGGNPVTSIGANAFRFCTSLTSITIGNGVTSIGLEAFRNCTSLTSITIPDSVTSIGDFAFYDCTSLTSITIPDGVSSIGTQAFSFCTSLTNITLPDGVTSIGDDVFWFCTSLTNITIPDGVTSIGESAFRDCTNLTSITFQGAAPTVGASAFSGVSDGAVALVVGSTSFGESGADWNGLTVDPILTWTTTNGEVTITDCDETASGELVIPDTIEGNPVTSIGDDAFRDCGSLTSITIPGGVTSIGVAAFRDCTSLTSMTIPDSVTSIGGAAFYQCTGLTNITIPDGVTSIENGTFRGCISLTSITIPNGVTSIGQSAFYNCSNLTTVSIPDSVTSIGDRAFEQCPAAIEIRPVTQNQLAAQLATVTAERDAAIAERDTRPTQAAYDAAVATARTAGQGDVTGDPASYSLFTEDQIRTMSVDHTVGLNEAGNMQVKIGFIQSADLNTYTPFTVIPDSLSVVDGKICMEFPPSDDENFFFRFRIE